MCVWISKPVVVQYLKQFCFFERGDCLSWFVMIYENDLEAWRIQNITLACNSQIQSVFINDPVIIIFIAQDAVEKIADMPVGGIFRNICIRRVLAWRGHHLAHGSIAGARSERLGKISKETKTIDKTIRFAIFPHHWRNTARTAGESPCCAELRIRMDGVESLHDGLKAGRCVGEQDRRF
jgi:hypothetical protein